jgi:hypothetical protein
MLLAYKVQILYFLLLHLQAVGMAAAQLLEQAAMEALVAVQVMAGQEALEHQDKEMLVEVLDLRQWLAVAVQVLLV